MKKLLVFAAGVWTGIIVASVMENVTFHTGTCRENIASQQVWGQESTDESQGGMA